jgi:hypothetical protein
MALCRAEMAAGFNKADRVPSSSLRLNLDKRLKSMTKTKFANVDEYISSQPKAA